MASLSFIYIAEVLLVKRAEARNEESLIRLYSIPRWWLGEKTTTVQRPGATIWRSGAWRFFCWRWSWAACHSAFWFVILVVMEWTAAITGGLFLDFFSEEKKFWEPFSRADVQHSSSKACCQKCFRYQGIFTR
jgi:hypothetical protein